MRLALRLRSQRARKQPNLDAHRRKQPLRASIVLSAEHFRRRHERRLIPAYDGERHRAECDRRLPAAHIALDQPCHCVRAAHIARHLAQHARLRARRRK